MADRRPDKIVFDRERIRGMEEYLLTLHRLGAIDETAMKLRGGYFPLPELIKRWDLNVENYRG